MVIWEQQIFYQGILQKVMHGYNLHFLQPQTIKAITMVGGGNPGVFGIGADRKRQSQAWKQVMMESILNLFA